MSEYRGLKLPERYFSEDANESDKSVFEHYKQLIDQIKESQKYARGQVFDCHGRIWWEEPLEEYEARMEKLKND